MKRGLIIMVALAAALTFGCSQGKAKELWETAQFEEKQTNLEHAKKLYEQLVSSYPETEEGKNAKKRLDELKAAGK